MTYDNTIPWGERELVVVNGVPCTYRMDVAQGMVVHLHGRRTMPVAAILAAGHEVRLPAHVRGATIARGQR